MVMKLWRILKLIDIIFMSKTLHFINFILSGFFFPPHSLQLYPVSPHNKLCCSTNACSILLSTTTTMTATKKKVYFPSVFLCVCAFFVLCNGFNRTIKWNAFWQTTNSIEWQRTVQTSCVFTETQKICCSNYGWQCQVGSERQSQRRKRGSFVCCDVKTKEQFIVWKPFTRVPATAAVTALAQTHQKKWQLVKLCANWKAVKSGLICMDTKHVGMSEHAGAGVKVTMNQSFGMAFASIVLSVCTCTHTHHSSRGQEFRAFKQPDNS